MVSQTISHYRIIKQLGAGGMGEVYLAEDTQLARHVAIKLLPPESADDEQARKRLILEARAAARLDHSNICAIYEVGEEASGSFIVMQYIEGDNLARIIQKRPLDLSESLDIAIQILDALSEAHSQGIIHRDIKPRNIIVTPRGQVKVLDFGLAKTMPQCHSAESGAETQSILTEAGVVMGTVGYMSPEQARGARLDARTDLFSAGAVLYECVTGRPAFTGNNPIDICAQLIHVDPPPPSSLNAQLPPTLDGIILRALAKKADARYQSAREMMEALRLIRDSVPSKDRAPAGSEVPSTPTQSISVFSTLSDTLRKRKAWSAALIVVPVIALLAFWLISSFWRAALVQPRGEAKRWYDAGTNALREGAYYQASKALERSIRLDDKFPLAHARLAEAWSELDYSDKAKDELLRVAALVPDRSTLPSLESLHLKAITDTVIREYSSAIDSYRRIATEVPEPEKPFAYVDLGRAYEKNEDISKAIESYQEATRRDPQYAAPFLRLGILHGRRQDMDRATQAFDKAESLFEGMSNFEGVVEVLFQRGQLLNKLDKMAEARTLLERAFTSAQTTANKYQQARILMQLSSVFWSEANTVQAKEYAASAIKLAQDNQMENLAAAALIEQGNTFFSRGEYAEAETSFQQALTLSQRNKGRRTEAKALLSLGSLNIQRDQTDEGIRYVEQALAFYKPGGYRKEVSQGLTLLGRAQRQKGNYDEALRAFEEQLQIAERLGDPAQVASSHSGIGTLLGYYQEQYAKALAHFEESFKINESLGAKLNVGYDLMNRANMLWQLGRYEEAASLFNQASIIATRPEAGYKQLYASICLWTARAALSERRLAEAKALAGKALDLAGTQYLEVIIEGRYTLGLAQTLSGGGQQGKTQCQEALTKANEIGNPRFVAESLLALAEVMLEAGDGPNAFAAASQVQEMSARVGRLDSEWKACLIAARASEQKGGLSARHEYASRAAILLSNLQPRFGPENYSSFLRRSDVQNYRKQLDRLLAANQ